MFAIKKQIKVEAYRWFSESKDYPLWFLKEIENRNISESEDKFYGKFLWVSTLEGVMCAREGDWIIKEVEGEIYPCKHSIFEKTYDIVLEEGLQK